MSEGAANLPQLVPREQTLAVLRAGFAERALILPPELLARAWEPYRWLAGRGYGHVPFAFVAELWGLCELGHDVRFASEHEGQGWDEDEAAARLAFEGEVLAQLLQSEGFRKARELITIDADLERRERRGFALVRALLRGLGPCWPRRRLLRAAALRELAFDARVLLEGEVAPEERGVARGERVEARRVIAERGLGALVDDAARFELGPGLALERESERLACREMLELAERLGPCDPRRYRARVEAEEVVTAFEDETEVPTGGFAELTTRGSIESLVRSELMYLEPDGDELDLFQLRFVEGELLYYKRDEGSLRRQRRAWRIVIDLGPRLGLKARESPAAWGLIAAGMALRLRRDALEIYELDALRCEVELIAEGGLALEESEELARLMSRVWEDELARGLVSVEVIARREDAMILSPSWRAAVWVVCEAGRAGLWEARLVALAQQGRGVPARVCELGRDWPRSGLSGPALEAEREAALRALVG